jgi:hypothetical protein
MPITCVKCGAINVDEVAVCSQCGSTIAGGPLTNAIEDWKPNPEREPQSPAASVSTNASVWSPPPLPKSLKALGYANLVIGPALAIVNLIVVGRSISLLEEQNAPEGLSAFFEINIAIFCVVGTLLVIGGIGLLRNRKWGRIWSVIAGVSCLLALLAVSVVSNVMQAMLTTGAIPLRPGQQSFYFKEVSGVTAFAPLYGILLIVLLMLPAARAWARSFATASAGGGESGSFGAGTPATPARTSGLAIASLVCSMIPFVLLTQMAGLTLGIVALVKIKRSDGRLGGRGFAIAGVIISSVILLLIGGILLAVWLLPTTR